ncbi:chloride intracellular channel protein 1-like isoform X1 [Ciona intestinalis]
MEEQTYQNVNEFEPSQEPETNNQDYLHHYQTEEEDLPPPPPPEHKYDFDEQSSTSSASNEPQEPISLGSMAESIVQGVADLKTSDKPTNSAPVVVNGDQPSETPAQPRDNKIALFVKAGSDSECIGCCPFSQRLFMILWLKGVVFNVTTVDKTKKVPQINDALGSVNPPVLIFNGEMLTDNQKCEDYIEAELYPPRYPRLACKHSNSNTIGNDIFAKFSAFAKFRGNPNDPKREGMRKKLDQALSKLNDYLLEPLDDEIDEGADDNEPQRSSRKFIDGNTMTIADCNMLPKLNMIQVTGRALLKYEIPESFDAIYRYLETSFGMPEFRETCPHDEEIVYFYGGRKPKARSSKH